jgi:hypothetical protein
MKTLFRTTALFLYMQLSFAVGLIPGESITRDPVTGNYIAIFWDEDPEGLGNDRFARATFETATKIEPTVRSRLKLHQDWGIGYQYQISNGKAAKQSIVLLDLYGLPLNTQLLNTQKVLGSDGAVLIEFYNFGMQAPANTCWYGSGANNGQTVNIGWMCKTWDYSSNSKNTSFGIALGASLGGFGLASLDLPGIFVAKLVGNTKWHHFSFGGAGPDNEKSSIGNQMGKIVRNDNIPHNIAAPLISVPTPFDPAIVLDNLRAHVATWPSKQLVEATFAAQLDRYLLSAAEAYRHNQPKAGKEHIETLRDMLKRVHKNLEDDDDEEHDGKQGAKHNDHPATQALPIDRLAARVLDFDLKYVQKRMEIEHKEH